MPVPQGPGAGWKILGNLLQIGIVTVIAPDSAALQVDKYDTPVTQSSDWKGGAVVIFAHVILISLLKNRVGFFQLFQCEDPRLRQIAAAEVQK